MDQTTGRILWSRGGDAPIIPASLTKMVTLHLAWKAVEEGRAGLDTIFRVPSHTDARSMPAGSSLMFLEEGMPVSLLELMRGLGVVSGNDAAETLAALLSSGRESFLEAMNLEAQALGGPGMKFYDPAGLDTRNTITPRSFARFLRSYLLLHPQSLELVHSLESFTFPSSLLRGFHTRPINQNNRNLLVGTYPGADGLKTGYIPESGYHVAATALRKGQRLIALVLGVPARSSVEGSKKRTAAAARLLDWGYENFPLTPLPRGGMPEVRVYYQDPGKVDLEPRGNLLFPLGKTEISSITVKSEAPPALQGPLRKGTPVGTLRWYLGEKEVWSVPLVVRDPGSPAPWWTALVDWLEIQWSSLTGRGVPAVPDLSIAN